ncbi:MAG: ATP-binding protein, partial [Bacteroidales bacterium]|nr:ATP-binding protein [Bacteroidales bacterium]
VQHEQQVNALYQVCWEMQDSITRQREIDGIVEASNVTKCDILFIITHNEEDIIKQAGKTINVSPAWKWMLKL